MSAVALRPATLRSITRGPAEIGMETSMGAKDGVRALLDRLPDDCTIVDVIDAILTIDDASLDETALPPLTQAQRDELDRRLDALERDAEPGTPWREALQEIRLDR